MLRVVLCRVSEELKIQTITVEELVPTYVGTGHKDLSDRCSEIDHHPPSGFSPEDFCRQGRHILESRS